MSKHWLGQAKFVAERQRGYAGWFNTLALLYLTFQTFNFRWWMLLAIPLYLLLVWVDIKFIFPAERSYADSKSDILQEIRNK